MITIKLDENVAKWLKEMFRPYSRWNPRLNGRKVYDAVKEALEQGK